MKAASFGVRLGKNSVTILFSYVHRAYQKMDFDISFGFMKMHKDLFVVFSSVYSQIIEQIADESVISQADVDKYLNDSLIPYVTQQYGKSFKVNATLEQFIRDLVNAVENGKLRSEVNLPFSHDQIICSSYKQGLFTLR